ncbi:hypothetical protein Tco_1184772 [Tanacetum coccineum]
MFKSSKGTITKINNIVCLPAFLSQEEPKNISEALKDEQLWVEAIKMSCHFMLQHVIDSSIICHDRAKVIGNNNGIQKQNRMKEDSCRNNGKTSGLKVTDRKRGLKTPTQGKTSWEEDISLTTLEAAKTLSKVASQSTGFEEVNTGGPSSVSARGQMKEKLNDYALLAKRLAEEEELTEQQKKRKAQVQFEAQFYNEEDWDAIRAKLKANAELTKGKDLSEQDFAKIMVDLVNQRKKHFEKERAKAKRNKPMTQSQLRIYMSNYLKNQGTWKLPQLKS